jgi:hypothetical protein
VADLVGAVRHDPPELRLLGERPVARIAPARAFPVYRADLDADAARHEPRQPVALEDAGTEGELEGRLVPVPDDELEQHVGVCVDDQLSSSR